jgi:predicted nucleic acid-binding protein
MQSLVLDASVTISALIEEAQSDEARDIFATIAADGAVVPTLWPLEVGHILLRAERRRLLESTCDSCHACRSLLITRRPATRGMTRWYWQSVMR